MSVERPISQMVQSILAGVVLAALTGVITMQVKNGEKLGDIQANMMPRQEVEIRLRQLEAEQKTSDALIQAELKKLDLRMQADHQAWESRAQAHDISISRLQFQIERTVQVGRP